MLTVSACVLRVADEEVRYGNFVLYLYNQEYIFDDSYEM
jgi:hypothetical protein